MKLKTDSTKKNYQHTLPKMIKCILVLLQFATATMAYAQTDSCTAHAYFTVTTTDYKSITITDHSTGSNLAYAWYFEDGTSSTDPNPGTHVYSKDDWHIISLKVTDTYNNCFSAYSDTIRRPCFGYFTFAQNQHDFNFTHDAYMNPATTIFAWDFGDGSTSTLADPSHYYVNTGSYKACLTVRSTLDLNCSDTRCRDVNVFIKDTTSVDSISCSAQFGYYPNTGFTYSFFASQTGRNYLWDFGDGTTSTLRTPQHTFPTSQYYNVCLTVTAATGPPCTDKYCSIINTNILYHCKADFTITGDSSTTDPYDFLIYNQSSGNNLAYLWNFGDGTTSTLVNPTHDYTGTGPYVICLTVKNDSCSNTYCDTLDLSDTLHHLLPNKFHITVVDKTITGIKKNDADKATLLNYPNPFTGTTTISYSISASSSVELEVYNLLGVKVATLEGGTKAPGNYTLEWNAQHLQEGIYLLQLKTNGQSLTKKIIINK